jgi:uncharacterized membrane protein YhaH (DUF805 family)
MFCSKCGKQSDGAGGFCGACGTSLGGGAPAPVGNHQAPVGNYQAPDRGAAAPPLGFGAAISSCFSKFATGRGRASPSEYWFFYLFCIILSVFTMGLGGLLTAIPTFAVMVRRLHDTNRSGWNWLWCLTIIGIIPMLIWLIQAGTPEPNKYDA